MNEFDLTFKGYRPVKQVGSHQIWKNQYGETQLLKLEKEELDNEDTIKKINIGKPKRTTKIIINPPKGPSSMKESKINKVKTIIKETQSDRVMGTYYSDFDPDLIRAYTDPQDVLNDENATSSLKDVAYLVLQFRMESEKVEENSDEKVIEMIMEVSKNVSTMTDEQRENHLKAIKKATESMKSSPPSYHHIVAHWDQATPDEKTTGINWYQDAHHMTKHIANDTKTPMHTMSGLVANYSPQTHWADNIVTAAKVARTKTPLGGKGSGVFASGRQKEAAGQMLAGEHYDKVLSGQKVKAFAHLIEHGDHSPDGPKHVVIDRHALSVAVGRKVNDMEFAQSGLKGKKTYNNISDEYIKAAHHISQKEGRPILPHHVQAATWLVRQRLNESLGSRGKAVSTIARNAEKKFHAYRHEFHPSLGDKLPGTGYSK